MREKRERTGSRTKRKKWKEKEEQRVKKGNERGEGDERKKREKRERTGRRTKRKEWKEKEREQSRGRKREMREAMEKRERRGRRGREVKERRERKLTDRNKDLSERLQLTYITSKELYIKIVKLESKWTLLCTTYNNCNNNKL